MTNEKEIEELKEEIEELKQKIKEVQEKFYKEIEKSVDFQKDLLNKFPDSEFRLGRIQGLRTAEDNFNKIFSEVFGENYSQEKIK